MDSVDGLTYKSVIVVSTPGNFSVVTRLYRQNSMAVEKWNNLDFEGGTSEHILESSSIIPDLDSRFTVSWSGNCAYKFSFSFKPSESGLHNFIFSAESDGLIYVDGDYAGYSYSGSDSNFQVQMSTDSGRLYGFEIHVFDRSSPSTSMSLQYSVNSGPVSSIGSQQMYYEDVLDIPSHLTSTSHCHPGYSIVESGNVVTWEIVCGDGLKKDEDWEDENLDNGDGCSSSCQIEDGYACSGGDLVVKDTWIDCRLTGQSPNEDKSDWETKWGDGMVADDEECDDGNEDSDDGCSSSWSFEFRYKCFGGSHSTSSTWQEWPDGETTDSDHTTCRVECGDRLRHSSEEWDDGNKSDSDGCSQSWLIDDDYVCFWRGEENKYVWAEWTRGTSQNEDKSQCVGVWGDGKTFVSEEWDDGNESDNDGCSSSWEIGNNYKINSFYLLFRGKIYMNWR